MTSSDSGMQSARMRSQRVRPNNGQQESLWAFLTLALILLISAGGVWLNQAPVPKAAAHLELNTEQKALLTQLSTAASEIRFLAEGVSGESVSVEGALDEGDVAAEERMISAEENPQWPSLATLESYGIPPFAGSSLNRSGNVSFRWLNPEPGCFIGENVSGNSGHFLLLMGEHLSQPAQLFSRHSAIASNPSVDSNSTNDSNLSTESDPCHPGSHWQHQLSEF
ncbi:hypothetical protein [Oceanospirillum sanctuarii]|uniref:hypothetical protein n=1 Tax=Oceanospirillum sanctuarii TaxID=1434821 RepID=UPI000A3AF020|nr:hypothetical protein [Oceanospirillum sanctuarii]